MVSHFLPAMPLRVSALRSLGAYMNVFSIEGFMDELAEAAGMDPVEFRLKHLDDVRARDAIVLARERFGWASFQRRPGRGRPERRAPATGRGRARATPPRLRGSRGSARPSR